MKRAWQRKSNNITLLVSQNSFLHLIKLRTLLEEKLSATFKQKVFEYYTAAMKDKVSLLQKILADLIDSTKNETKSSAGDKYETARTMLQIEQDNVRKQLKDALDQKSAFDKLDQNLKSAQIARGSLVKTDKGCFFVSVALGKIAIEGVTIIALSPLSPLGTKLLGLKNGDSTTINGITYKIEQIF